jgi:hypothetical protein
MAEKKSRSSTPRKSTRSAKPPQSIDQIEQGQHRASDEVSTADATIATARNAVIEGNATIDIDAVRRRAYELYEERGGQHGLHEDDWYRAEQEIRARNRNNQQQTPLRKKSA